MIEFITEMLQNIALVTPRSTAGAGTSKYLRTSFDPKINRHTGKPHEHRREIARNLRRTAA